jgi:drug/metabolite transporter (DMT)-like permease
VRFLVWALTCFIWSTVWLAIKVGVRDVPPFTFAALRLLIALAVLVLFVAALRTPLPQGRDDWLLVVSSGMLLLGVNYACVYWGAQFIPSGLTAVLQAVAPGIGLLLEHARAGGERITPWKVVGLLAGVGGVAVVFADQLDVAGEQGVLACAAVLAGAACVAMVYVLVKWRGRHLAPAALTVTQTASGLVLLLPVALIREGNPIHVGWTPAALASLLYLALAGSVAAFWLNYWLLRRMTVTAVLLMSIVQPLVAVLLGALILGESLPAGTAAGAVAIVASAALLLR